MMEKEKLPILIVGLCCIGLLILSFYFKGINGNLIQIITILVVIGAVLIVNNGEEYSYPAKRMEIIRIALIGFFMKESSDAFGSSFKDILFVLGSAVFHLSVLFLLISYIVLYRKYKSALKDAFRLSEQDFKARLSGYSDIQLFSIIQHLPTYRIRDKIPLVYKEFLRRDLCDEEEAEAQNIKYLIDDGGDDWGIYFRLSRKFLIRAKSKDEVGASSVLIRIDEIESIIYSKWSYTRPAYFRIYFRMNGRRKYVGLLSFNYVEQWKNAFESVGLKVEERIKSKDKGKEELSRVSQDSWDF